MKKPMKIGMDLNRRNLVRKVKDELTYHSKDKFWGKMVMERLSDSPSPEFRVTKMVTLWDKTFTWGVMLEIEPIVADPKPTEYQKERYLYIVENIDALFLKTVRTLHIHFGEVKEYVAKHRRLLFPRVLYVPLLAETEWSIYIQSIKDENFILHYKGDTFLKVENYGKLAKKTTLAIAE